MGRKSFHSSGLQSLAVGLAARVFHQQLTHKQYLEARTEITRSKAWASATERAHIAFMSYLDGAIDLLHTSGAIVWKHRDRATGEWLPSPLPAGRSYADIDPTQSRHVWAKSDKVFYGDDVKPYTQAEVEEGIAEVERMGVDAVRALKVRS